MPAVPTERDSVYAIVLCYGQGDAARQTMRDDPRLVIGMEEENVHADNDELASSSLTRRMPPAPHQHSGLLPESPPIVRIGTNSPLPDHADDSDTGYDQYDDDEGQDLPEDAGSPHMRDSSFLGNTTTPGDTDRRTPLRSYGSAGQQLYFTPQGNSHAAAFIQEGPPNVPRIFNQFEHPEPRETDEPAIDGDLFDIPPLDLGDIIANDLPPLLEAVRDITGLLRSNELTSHPSRAGLVLDLHAALVPYMRRHGLSSSAPLAVVVPAQEAAAAWTGGMTSDRLYQQSISDDASVTDDSGHATADEAHRVESAATSSASASLTASSNLEPSSGRIPTVSGAADVASSGVSSSGSTSVTARHPDVGVPATSSLNDPPSLLPRTSGGSEALSWIYSHYSRVSDNSNRDLSLIRAVRVLQELQDSRLGEIENARPAPEPARTSGTTSFHNGFTREEKKGRTHKLRRVVHGVMHSLGRA